MPRHIRRVPPVAGVTGVKRIDLQTFARKLQEHREKLGLSKSDLARAMWGEHTTPTGQIVAKNRDRITQYEKGKSYPEPDNLKKLAELLEIPVEELAPDITAATIDREDPEIQMTAVRGHADKAHLTVNILVPLTVAAEVISLLSKYTEK